MEEAAADAPADSSHLPTPIQHAIDAFIEGARDALGEGFIGALLYGSAVHEGWSAEHSDINILLITTTAGKAECDALSAPLQRAERALPLALEVITRRDLERSADVFPLKFLDMQRNHLLLEGEDALGEVPIAWDHLRLRVEQQLKEVAFDLRHNYLLFREQPEQLLGFLRRAYSDFLISSGALLFLKDGEWWVTGKDAIRREVVEALAVDEGLMDRMQALQRREFSPNVEQLRELYGEFMACVEAVASIVDQMEDTEQVAAAAAAAAPNIAPAEVPS